MKILTRGVPAYFNNHGTETTSAPPDGTILFRIVTLLVNHVNLIKDGRRFRQTNTVFALYRPVLIWVEITPHEYNGYTIVRRSQGRLYPVPLKMPVGEVHPLRPVILGHIMFAAANVVADCPADRRRFDLRKVFDQ